MDRHLRAALLLLPLAGCANLPVPPPAALPFDAVQGAGDPTRSAIIGTAYALGTPSSLAGRPGDAARAAANYEHIAVEIPTGPRWRGFSPILGGQLAAGRDELRAALGIAPEAPPQAVIDGLYAAGRALRVGDGAAAERLLSPPVFQAGGAATLQRLAALPLLPRASIAANLTASELDRQERGDTRRGGGGGSGGRG